MSTTTLERPALSWRQAKLKKPFLQKSTWPGLVYFAIVCLTCAWVLSLPIFPSQDEPLHLYYVNSFKQLLLHQHSVYTAAYRIRYLLPPYAAYYYALIGLSSVMSLEVADKVFAAANIALLASAGYLLVRVLSPGARWAPFLFLPILLNWPSLMGFANFMLSVSLAILAVACWFLGSKRAGLRYAGIFVCLVAAMILTHPLPWAFAVSFAALELTVRYWAGRKNGGELFRKNLYRDFLVILLSCSFYFYLVPFQTKTQTITRVVFDNQHHVVRTIGLTPTGMKRIYWQAFSLLHSHGIILFLHSRVSHLYRLGIAALYAGALLVALRDATKSRGSLRSADILLLYSVLLATGLILVPDSGVGGYYISTRMQILAYIGTIAAAAPGLERRRRVAPLAAGLSVSLSLFTLFLAVRYINPIARDIAALRTIPGPDTMSKSKLPGLLMRPVGADIPPQLTFDPYNWAPAHYYRWHGLLFYNTPWLGEKLIPIQPRPEILSKLDQTFFNQSPEFGDTLLLDGTVAQQTLEKVRFALLQTETVKAGQSPFSETQGGTASGAFAADWECKDVSNARWTLCERSPRH